VEPILHTSTQEDGWRRLSNTMRNDRYLPDHQFRISIPHTVTQLHIVHPSRPLPRKFYPTFTARRALREIYSPIRAKSLLFQWGPLSTSEMYVMDCCTPRSSRSSVKRSTSTMKKSLCLLQRRFLHALQRGSSP